MKPTETSNQLTDSELLESLQSGVDGDDHHGVEDILDSIDTNERTRLISRLSAKSQSALVATVDTEHGAEILHDLPDVQAVEILEELTPTQAAEILHVLPKDEQADLVGDLPAETADAILSEMPTDNATAIRELAEFDDEEAGGIMVVEYLAFQETDTVDGIVAHLRKHVDSYSDFDVQYAFIVDDKQKLKGVLRLRDLLLSPGSTSVSKIMIPDPLAVNTTAHLKDLHFFFLEHRFIGVPVVNQAEQLVGVIRRTDVEEAMSEKYAEDYRKSQGIINEELRTMPFFLRSRRRLAWLSVNILLNIAAASVIAVYQDVLAQVIALAVFLPIISDMSGCSGNQAVAVSMRELSLGLINVSEVMRVWLKEIVVGLINGLALGVLIAIVAFLWKGNPWLGGVVGIAMMLNTIIAVSLGGTLPLVMRKFNLDPALASGPILTTVTDMCGFFLVLSFASMFLDKLV